MPPAPRPYRASASLLTPLTVNGLPSMMRINIQQAPVNPSHACSISVINCWVSLDRMRRLSVDCEGKHFGHKSSGQLVFTTAQLIGRSFTTPQKKTTTTSALENFHRPQSLSNRVEMAYSKFQNSRSMVRLLVSTPYLQGGARVLLFQ